MKDRMNNIRGILLLVILVLPMMGSVVSLGAEREEYISDMKIVSADSEEEAIKKLKEDGYEPVMKNISDEKPELASPYVYIGYRTTTDPAGALELKKAGSTGSVFGESALMIGGIAMILGVVIGMISMRVRPQSGKKTTENDAKE